jgi:dimethylglycine dehydrogenase
MDVFINWNKDFVGKEATLKFKQDGVTKRLVTLIIDTAIDASLDEAILKDGNAIGYISSGGYAHYVGKSMAMGYVDSAYALPGTLLDVEILGEFLSATVQGASLYDPGGHRMRG